MKKNIILIFIFIKIVISETEYSKCIRLNKIYPKLDMDCDKLINNSNLINGYENFKNSFVENYNKYMNDPDYGSFITQFYDKLNKKQNLRQEFRFVESDQDFSNILDPKIRTNIDDNFIKTLSDERLLKQIDNQGEQIKNSHVKEITEKFENFNKRMDSKSLDNFKAKSEGTRLYNTLVTFVDKHKDEYKTNGIMTVQGSIRNEKLGDYVSEESNLVKNGFSEKTYKIKDIDKIMHLDKLLN